MLQEKQSISYAKELELNSLNCTVFVQEKPIKKFKNSLVTLKIRNVTNTEDVKLAFDKESDSDVKMAFGSKDVKGSIIRSIGSEHIPIALHYSQSKAYIHAISDLGVAESWSQLIWIVKLISNVLIKSTRTDHNKQEKCLKRDSISYYIIRPVGLKVKDSKGELHVQNEGFLPSNSIQRANVVKLLAKSLLGNKTGISGICQKT